MMTEADVIEVEHIARCEDCGLNYQDFCLDTVLTNEQWAMIHPGITEGMLCANCIVKRASFFDEIICAKMILQKKEDYK